MQKSGEENMAEQRRLDHKFPFKKAKKTNGIIFFVDEIDFGGESVIFSSSADWCHSFPPHKILLLTNWGHLATFLPLECNDDDDGLRRRG